MVEQAAPYLRALWLREPDPRPLVERQQPRTAPAKPRFVPVSDEVSLRP